LSVTVAEPRTGPIDKACGEGLMPAAVTRLAAIGVRPHGHPLRGIRYLDPRHRADARACQQRDRQLRRHAHIDGDAIALLQDLSRLNRVSRCPGRGCGWLFLNTSGRRRWCSMSTCGSRDKMRRLHQRRTQNTG